MSLSSKVLVEHPEVRHVAPLQGSPRTRPRGAARLARSLDPHERVPPGASPSGDFARPSPASVTTLEKLFDELGVRRLEAEQPPQPSSKVL
jgi:hypothetical protein